MADLVIGLVKTAMTDAEACTVANFEHHTWVTWPGAHRLRCPERQMQT